MNQMNEILTTETLFSISENRLNLFDGNNLEQNGPSNKMNGDLMLSIFDSFDQAIMNPSSFLYCMIPWLVFLGDYQNLLRHIIIDDENKDQQAKKRKSKQEKTESFESCMGGNNEAEIFDTSLNKLMNFMIELTPKKYRHIMGLLCQACLDFSIERLFASVESSLYGSLRDYAMEFISSHPEVSFVLYSWMGFVCCLSVPLRCLTCM
jgi:hypothetical protein